MKFVKLVVFCLIIQFINTYEIEIIESRPPHIIQEVNPINSFAQMANQMMSNNNFLFT
jgi:hypothetical protein